MEVRVEKSKSLLKKRRELCVECRGREEFISHLSEVFRVTPLLNHHTKSES